eukprot:g2221.t1
MKDLKLLKLIGEGTFGEVWTGTYKNPISTESCVSVAVKKMVIHKTGEDLGFPKSIVREYLALCSLNGHPNIVNLIGATGLRNEICLVFEECLGDLQTLLDGIVVATNPEKAISHHLSSPNTPSISSLAQSFQIDHAFTKPNKPPTTINFLQHFRELFLPEPQTMFLTWQKDLLTGLAFLDLHNILHRDIKPSNLLFATKRDSFVPVLKIADFGLARLKNGNKDENRSKSKSKDKGEEPGQFDWTQKSTSSAQQKPMTPVVATLWYRAPELIFAATDYRSSVDIWSAALVWGEMLRASLYLHFKAEQNQNQKLKHHRKVSKEESKIQSSVSRTTTTAIVTDFKQLFSVLNSEKVNASVIETIGHPLVLFPGLSEIDQLAKIFITLGTDRGSHGSLVETPDYDKVNFGSAPSQLSSNSHNGSDMMGEDSDRMDHKVTKRAEYGAVSDLTLDIMRNLLLDFPKGNITKQERSESEKRMIQTVLCRMNLELFAGMLCLPPEKRWTADQALNFLSLIDVDNE